MTAKAELIVEGRIATLGGDAGFGWVDALAIAGGRILAAGSVSEVAASAGPGTRRLVLDPSEVAIPGLTDAHLHLAQAANSARHLDLAAAATLEDGLRRIADAHRSLAGPDAWLLGHGWESDRWGGWPTAADLEGVAPGRAVVLWAHDHHSLWASRTGLGLAGIGPGTPDPDGGEIRRDLDGVPTGVLHEAASGLVTAHVPAPTADELGVAIPDLARQLVALGVVAVHDPGDLIPDPNLAGGFRAYARLSDAGRLPVRVHASLRAEGITVAAERGHRSGERLGASPEGRARVGWQKLFADGSLGSRTAALLEPFTFEPERPLEAGRERGIFITEPGALAELTSRAAQVGIVTQIHAIGDAALRAALDALEPHAGRGPLRTRIEHVQLVDPIDLPRFGRIGVAASVQPVHLRSDAAQARHLWGDRAERSGYPWRSLSDSGALLPFGTDAPVEPIDPWPGMAIAVTRADPSWPAGTPPFGPEESLTLARALRAACLDAPLVAGETDRGRLVAGQRADLLILPAASLGEPVEAGGPLATSRPRLVLMDGVVAYEA
ncbi:MAG: amidohydrolase [Chloroflexota bacterium]